MPESSPSALIIRLDAIGDALALTPLLAALHAHEIPVDVVLHPANADVFSSRAAGRIVASSFELRSSERSNLAAIAAFGSKLAARRYTHVLVATEDPGGYRLAGATGASVRVGFSNGWAKPLKSLWSRAFLTESIYRSAGLDPRAPHECEVLFRLGRELLGAAAAPSRDARQLRPLVLESEPQPDDRIAVQISDKWERLGIDLVGVVELVERLGAVYGRLRLISAKREGAYADRVAQLSRVEIERFDATEPWKAAIAAAPAIVAPDSGALHVAGIVGTPTVAVFPPGKNFALQVARWAPWAAPHRIVRADDGWPARATDALAQLR